MLQMQSPRKYNEKKREDDLNTILGGAIYDVDKEMESLHILQLLMRAEILISESKRLQMPSALMGTNGLVTIEGRQGEMQGEGPCQAPSLAGSNMQQ